MSTVKLSTLVAGRRFYWSEVLFEATHETVEFEGQPHRRVLYKSASGLGTYQPGDKGLIPVDTDVEPFVGMTSEVES